MDIVIRECTMDDLETLRDLAIRTYVEAFESMNTKENMRIYLATAFSKAKLQEELSNPASRFYFAYGDGELAGWMKLNESEAQTDIHDPESLEVERVYVLKAFQSASVGKSFLDRAMQIARKRGKTYLWLGAWKDNHRALKFYLRYGFRIIGEHSFFVGEDEQSDFIMRKDIEDGGER